MKRKRGAKMPAVIGLTVLGLCAACAAALLCISGFFLPQKYLEPWSKSYSQQFSDPRMQLAADGLLAASNHNMQPWKIKLDPNDSMKFYLYADSTRRTDQVDPYSRQMMISQGTFLEYIAVAGNETGWHTNIRLFPQGSYDESNLAKSMDTKPVAEITLSKTQSEKDPLYDGLFYPDTNREAYQSEKLTDSQVNALKSLSAEKGLSVNLFQDRDHLNKIGNYAINSANIEAGVTRVMDESNAIFRPNEYQKNQFRCGYSVEGQGTDGLMKHFVQGLVTLFPSLNTGKAASENFINYTRTSVENTPAYAMIATADNSRTAQVQAGML